MRKSLSRKFIAVIAAVLAVTMAAPAALAFPGGQPALRGKGSAKWQGFVQLRDIKGHWAEADVLEMTAQGSIQGYPGGTFQPNRPVTHAEALVMLVRALGLEDESGADLGNARHRIPQWAQNAVSAAVYAGILTEAELADFRPNQPAKRYEIAVYLARGLDLDEEGELGFVDKSAIPVWARVHVALVTKAQLMIGEPAGPGFKFQPQKPVTRAEMAALMVRIQERLRPGLPESWPVLRVVGTVTDVYIDQDADNDLAGTLTVERADDKTVTVDVYDDTRIYERGRIGLGDIDEGDVVRLIAVDGKAIFIRVLSEVQTQTLRVRIRERNRVQQEDRAGQTGQEGEEQEISGTLEDIAAVDGKVKLTVTTADGEKTFEVAGNTAAKIRNRQGWILSLWRFLKTGQEVELTLKDGAVVKIVVE
ncbi:MAG: S-layer homology domain-containing protein [Desulfotomaculales bacterium]